ncbi:MAG: cyclic pyranopterin monophosphate synthase MoaC [Deferribacterota bacterium]|nr:cyclic pyranopterin monophosphate synthase MoaC [Deferribacterota bacterium]
MEFTHIDEDGKSRMVDISNKKITERMARAKGKIFAKKATIEAIEEGRMHKGNVIETGRIAGYMAAKRTDEFIPMCHTLPIEFIDITVNTNRDRKEIEIISTIKVNGKTGAEMEALVAVATTALTIYDMCKAVDKDMVISDIKLIEKKGGKSGHFIRNDET